MLYLSFLTLIIAIVPPFGAQLLGQLLNRPVHHISPWWQVAAVAIVAGISVYHLQVFSTLSNFLLHAVGGGVVVSLLYGYATRSLRVKLPVVLDLMLLFAVTSALGTLNELAEFALDILNLAEFSLDRQDTWRDLLANTSGALVGWALTRRRQ